MGVTGGIPARWRDTLSPGSSSSWGVSWDVDTTLSCPQAVPEDRKGK